VRGKLVKDLKVESVLGRTGEELLVSIEVAKLEGEPLVITVARATSLGRSVPLESASAGSGSALAGGAEPIGRPSAFRTARRIVRGSRVRRGPARQLEQDPIQSCPQQAGQRQGPIRERQASHLSEQRTELGADFNRGDGK
jgi:hypothetical protein